MAHDVLVLCVFLLIRPCCRQLQWAGSSVRRYLLKWEGERGSTGLIYCLCRGESERGGVKSEKEKRDSSLESLELSETGWSLSRVKEESKWIIFFLLPHLQETFPKLLRFSTSSDSSVSLSWEPVIDLIWPLLNKSLSGITQHASRSAESSALMLFWWGRERTPPLCY